MGIPLQYLFLIISPNQCQLFIRLYLVIVIMYLFSVMYSIIAYVFQYSRLLRRKTSFISAPFCFILLKKSCANQLLMIVQKILTYFNTENNVSHKWYSKIVISVLSIYYDVYISCSKRIN